MRVIVISKDGQALSTGEFLGMYKLADHHTDAFPYVKMEDGDILVCFGSILPYSAKLFRMLNLAGQDAIDFATELTEGFRELSRECAEIKTW